jgi:hypothetical protein
MRKVRATWLAVIGSILLLSLSVAGVFGHAASGLDVAASTGAFAAHHESGDATTHADEDADEDADADDSAPQTPTDNHGACAAAVAQSVAVGGAQLNHGGAVSEAARVTCRSTDGPVAPQTDKQAAKDARQAAKDARRAEHEANKATKTHGHGHGHDH